MININEFMTSINRDGVLKTNKYEALIPAPEYLNNSASRLLTLRCDSATIPGMSFASLNQVPRLGYGSPETIPYGVLVEDYVLTFLLDGKSQVHKFFYDWTNSIVNYKARGQSYGLRSTFGNITSNAHEVGYKKKYVSDITINVRDDQDNIIMTAIAYKSYPKMIPQLNMSWGNTDELIRIPIEFSCTDIEIRYPQLRR